MPISVKTAGHRKAAEATHRPRSATMVRTLSSMTLHDRDRGSARRLPLLARCRYPVCTVQHWPAFKVDVASWYKPPALSVRRFCQGRRSAGQSYSPGHWEGHKGAVPNQSSAERVRAGGRCHPRHLDSTPDRMRKCGAGHTRAARRRRRPLPAFAHRHQQGHWESRARALCASPNPLACPWPSAAVAALTRESLLLPDDLDLSEGLPESALQRAAGGQRRPRAAGCAARSRPPRASPAPHLIA